MLVFDAIPCPLSVIPESALHGVKLPAFAERGLQQLVGVRIVGDTHLVRIVLEFASGVSR